MAENRPINGKSAHRMWDDGYTFFGCKVTLDWLVDAFGEHVESERVFLAPTVRGQWVPTYLTDELIEAFDAPIGEIKRIVTDAEFGGPSDHEYQLSDEQAVAAGIGTQDGYAIGGAKPPDDVASSLDCTYNP
jgi:hypothetical protein